MTNDIKNRNTDKKFNPKRMNRPGWTGGGESDGGGGGRASEPHPRQQSDASQVTRERRARERQGPCRQTSERVGADEETRRQGGAGEGR